MSESPALEAGYQRFIPGKLQLPSTE